MSPSIIHGAIALHMGLVSFYTAMSAALLLYLSPAGHGVPWPRKLWRRLRPEATEEPVGGRFPSEEGNDPAFSPHGGDRREIPESLSPGDGHLRR
jgi:hypothetical protein